MWCCLLIVVLLFVSIVVCAFSWMWGPPLQREYKVEQMNEFIGTKWCDKIEDYEITNYCVLSKTQNNKGDWNIFLINHIDTINRVFYGFLYVLQ